MSSLKRQPILLVQRDDERGAQFIEALSHLGYSVHLHDEAQAAIAAFSRRRYGLVMVDMHLSLGVGEYLLKQFSGEDSDAQVIMLSRKRVMTEAMSVMRQGACDYLVLPIMDLDILEHAISRARASYKLKRENRAYRRKLEEANTGLLQSLKVLEQDQQAGRHVQFQLLPETPKDIGSYNFCHHIKPSLYLSGDFADYFAVGEQYAVFFMADVSGHGSSSAFVTVLLKNLFARKRSDYLHRDDEAIISPAIMLAKANRELLGMGIGKHVTMCVGVIDLQKNCLTYSNAGHLPEPVLLQEGEAIFLQGHDLPVGLFEGVEYTEYAKDLAENAVLSFFSDGILEVIDGDDVEAKEALLLATMAEGHGCVEEVVRAFDLESKEDAPDDIAVLMVSRQTPS